ncbi:MAG: hypothetical protein QW680_10940 [Pyrobaculum sp.]
MTESLFLSRSLAYIIYNQLNRGKRKLQLHTESLREAYHKVVKEVYVGNLENPYGGVRGPPGTGKTALAETAMSDNKIIGRLTDQVFLYEAHTNELITSTFHRLLSLSVETCQDVKEFLRSVRLYGSMVPRPYIASDYQLLKSACSNITEEDLRKVTEGNIDQDVKFIFSTEFQRASAKMRVRRKFLLFVDEASTSPFYLPYTPLSDAALKTVVEEGKGLIEGLVVVGDERQAIGVGPEYQGWGEHLLVLPKIRQMLEKLGLTNQFYHLKETLRLPAPTEDPLDQGFYSDIGGLRAVEDFQSRYRKLGLYVWLERWGKCTKQVYLIDILKRGVENVLSARLPLLIVNLKQSYKGGEKLEPKRIDIAIKLAALFKCLYPHLEITVTGPYRDLVGVAKLNYVRRYQNMGQVHFLSVQSMLGKESDIVISILGKEYAGEEEKPTIYFMEPNNLNVQLSRHRAMLIVIGDVVRLRNVAAKTASNVGLPHLRRAPATMIRKTCDGLLELAGVKNPRRVQLRHSTGEGGVFINLA